MISKFFIDRPVLANVLAVVMMLIGGVALFTLPISQYPNVVPPTVQVTTSYPGASAKDVMNAVALPIEQQVNGVEGMLYMQSTSASDGSYNLIVTFAIGTDLNFAQVLVQNRVSAALASLPASVQQEGVVVQKKSTAILQIVSLSSPDNSYNGLFLSNYATISLVNELARLPGVGNVNVFGAGAYSMRVWLDPNLMQARGLTTQNVISALQQQSQQVTAGEVGSPPAPAGQDFQYSIIVAGRLDQVGEFENVIVKTGNNGQVTRLRDVGRVELGAQSYSQSFTIDGKPAAGIAIYQTPNANALQVATEVRTKMAALAPSLPKGVVYAIPFDTTTFVKASITEVYKTLGEAGLLVLLVIVVFLQDWRATLVPATTVPVTIIAAFAAMAALGFTVNLSTLFAIVLAIGIVVDDAIVVVESASHYIEQGMSAHDASITAMNQLFGPIIGITLVLMSVFVPAAFLPGLTGQMFAQFALVIAATALISAINAATLKPTQCATFLRRPTLPEQKNFFFRGFNNVYGRIENRYAALIGWMVRRSLAMVAIALLVIGAGVYGLSRVPTAFLPLEDQGYMIIGAQLPPGASLERTNATLSRISGIVAKVPGAAQVFSIGGISFLDNSATSANAGVVYLIMKDWSVRGPGEDLPGTYRNLVRALEPVQDAKIYVLPPPPIQGIGNAGGFTQQVELRDGSVDFRKLADGANTLVANARGQSGILTALTSFTADVPQVALSVDRVKAQTLQVGVGDVFQALATYMGSTYVNQFNKFGRTWQVFGQADSKFRLTAADIALLKVRNAQGQMIPLGTLLDSAPSVGPGLIQLYNLYPAASIIGSEAPGFSSGQVLDIMDQAAKESLPPGMAAEWTAMSFQERTVGNQLVVAFGLGIVLVYLVLAGQYESWLVPVSVILAVPLALIGPVVVLSALGVANNLYTQIGLILIVALSAKNAILVVEVAREERVLNGMPILEAAVAAAKLRLRPILMTSLAFSLGVLPLVLATGAGANARKSIGIACFSGMIASTLLAVIFVPSFFVVVQRFAERRKPSVAEATTA